MQCRAPEWHDSLASTNGYLLALLQAGAAVPDGYVVAARTQTAGRGRHGRTWASVPGQDLTFSVLLRTQAEPRRQLSAPMAAALAVATGLERDCGLAAQVKWPNDVQVTGRKISGLLAESDGQAMVIGIGLNVNMPATVAAQVDQPATSVLLETGRPWDPPQLLTGVLAGLADWLTRWESDGFAGLRHAWLGRCAYLGEMVDVGDGAGRISGRLVGFGDWGQACLAQPDGSLREAWSGRLRRA